MNILGLRIYHDTFYVLVHAFRAVFCIIHMKYTTVYHRTAISIEHLASTGFLSLGYLVFPFKHSQNTKMKAFQILCMATLFQFGTITKFTSQW